MRLGREIPLILGVLLVHAVSGAAQQKADTLRQRSDTTAVDTIPVRPGAAGPEDTVPPAASDTVNADTIFYNLPHVEGEAPTGWSRDVWTWDADEIQASGATTLAELVADVPGMLPLRGGDYGAPLGLSAFGLGGGRVRILRDGFEVLPLEGGSTDLARVGLGGISRVRLERNPGEIIIRMRSLQYDDGRPYSLVEAGTGDLDTNFFRGTFADPATFKGSVALALERNDTRGPRGNEPGNRNGSWLRYQLHHGDAAGLSVDFRRMSNETSITDYAAKSTRTDWAVRGSARLAPGLVAEAYTGKSIYSVDDQRTAYAREGGSVSQTGVLTSFRKDGFWAQGQYRHFGGDGLPSQRLDLSTGADTRIGGWSGELERSSWKGTGTSAKRVRAWTAPIFGVLSAFGSWESGSYGARTGPILGPPLPDTTSTDSTTTTPPADATTPGPLFRVSDRTASRVGAEFSWRGFDLSGARLREEADSLLPLGLQMDRGEPALPGGRRSGWELWASIPMPLDGLHLEGSLQKWDQAWSYLPRRIYQGAFVFHDTFLSTGDLELWFTVGVRGRDPMSVRRVSSQTTDPETGATSIELAGVPFYQDWYGLIQIRIVTVRLFIGWDNFAIRRNLQDFPDRVLPLTRSYYGVRWTMWN